MMMETKKMKGIKITGILTGLVLVAALMGSLFLWGGLPGCDANGYSKVDCPNDSATLKHLKTVLWPKAYREQDTKMLGEILADEFQMVDGEGVWSNKKQELEYIKKNKPTYDAFKFTIKRLDIFKNGTAVVAGEGHIKGTGKNGAYDVIYQSSNVLVKRNGRWQAISSHVSGAKDLKKKI